MGKTKKLDPDGVRALWNRIFSNMKIITGDVDVKNKGTLQAQIDKKVSEDGDASNTSVDFKVAQTRTLPVTGSKTKNIFANVVRWLTDLKPFVFMDLIQNATTYAVDRAVSAAVAKALQDQINELNTNIAKINPGGNRLRSNESGQRVDVFVSGNTGYIDFCLQNGETIRLYIDNNGFNAIVYDNSFGVKKGKTLFTW